MDTDREGTREAHEGDREVEGTPEEARPDPAGTRGDGRGWDFTGSVLAGLILIAVGADILLESLLGRDVDLFLLAVGVALMAFWRSRRHHGLLIAGGVVSGLGLASFLGSLLGGPFTSEIRLLSLAGGFLMIGVLSGGWTWRGRGRWAFIMALILSGIALLSIATPFLSLPFFFPGDFVFPVALIAVGLLLIFRRSIPPQFLPGLIAILIVLGLVAALSSGGR